MFEISYPEFLAICQVIMIDLVLAGDNAIVVGMAAATVAKELRRKVIFYGILLAVVLRIAFAAVTMELLGIIGLTLAGGILLLWVCWKLYREIQEQRQENAGAEMLEAAEGGDSDGSSSTAGAGAAPPKSLKQAIIQVAIADISMSLDNVLAVAGAADDHMTALVIGLGLSVVLMGVGASLIARLLTKHHWIGYVGLALIAYVAISMIWSGGVEVAAFAGI
jgi:YjbE family integral membrane protein